MLIYGLCFICIYIVANFSKWNVGTDHTYKGSAGQPTGIFHNCIFGEGATSILQISLPFEHCVFRECCVTVAVVTFCTRKSTETVLLRPRNVSVKICVQEVATATVTLQSRCTHGIRNVQTELKLQ